MAVKFYTDSHIGKAIAVQARKRGVEVLRCQDIGMDNAEDVEHLEYAAAHEYTVISADADFPILHNQWRASGKQHAGIIYVQPDRKDEIGKIVTYLEFLRQAIEGGAATLE